MRKFYEGEGEESGTPAEGADGGTPASGGDGASGTPTHWLDDYPDTLKTDPTLRKYETKESAAEAFLNAQKMVGKDMTRLIELPGADDDGTQLRGVLGRLGLPDDAGSYQLQAPEGTIEGLQPGGDLAKGFVASAHKAGVLPKQVQAIYADFVGALSQHEQTFLNEAKAAGETELATLKEAQGDAFEQNQAKVAHVISKTGGDDLKNALNDAGLGANPHIFKHLLQVAGMMQEDHVGSPSTNQGVLLAPEDAVARGKEYLQKSLAEPDQFVRKQLNDKAQEYFGMAYKGQTQ